MCSARFHSVILAALLLFATYVPGAASMAPVQDTVTPQPQQSHSGPLPPPEAVEWEASRPQASAGAVDGQVVLPAPFYYWRHGCGPTALGMIAGYWDARGYGDLMPGSAGSQTKEVNQAIASGGDAGSPLPRGSERHYEDYAAPEDKYGGVLEDAASAAGRTPHRNDSIADFMLTSRSGRGSPYGASWSNDVGPAWVGYVGSRNASYGPTFKDYYYKDYSPALTWEVLRHEIDAGRPMVLLVDSDRDGKPDHFVPAVGYREESHEYAFWDTWAPTLRWARFTGLNTSAPWGIWGGTTVGLQPVQPRRLPFRVWLPRALR